MVILNIKDQINQLKRCLRRCSFYQPKLHIFWNDIMSLFSMMTTSQRSFISVVSPLTLTQQRNTTQVTLQCFQMDNGSALLYYLLSNLLQNNDNDNCLNYMIVPDRQRHSEVSRWILCPRCRNIGRVGCWFCRSDVCAAGPGWRWRTHGHPVAHNQLKIWDIDIYYI